jgi:hypothetical protein
VARGRYEQLAASSRAAVDQDDHYLHDRGFPGYDAYASAGRNELDRDRLKADLDKLADATVLVEDYTNARIAHIGHEVDLRDLTYGELDRAIDAVGALAHKYYRLRHPEQGGFWYLTPTVEARWLAAFQHPWWTANFQPIRPEDLG